ncbi:hypothetical protein AMS68_007604 [Peltaster fructicola]|uniref:Xylanolytic transcriptional activator regulatory domain-containing protein n=1 Tax=Peltaster fructicola TaxID=286661 RepID=A0A6H0Y4W9_9PEZI|nr:hypothetical protein AMS68_007604 [Peltaster fructicola]
MMRSASVRMHDTVEMKFLGPASGIAIARLVMQLAKQFTDAKSIKDIVPDVEAAQSKSLYEQEQAKPTSKVYPVTSNVAAPDLPNRSLADILVQLYKLKVQPMYPALHEPTLDRDFELVYTTPEEATDFQNFTVRMVIAISLQKMDTQYAGLADSFYLAALRFMRPCVQKMDITSLQCFALMAEYSLLTPTRTAIYFVMGIALRLVQSLGFHEEKGITHNKDGTRATALEIDMRRRMFWCIFVMECGLAHALGRPCILATNQDHIDVQWFEMCEDKYITDAGIDPAAQPTLKKWITIHFFKMRLLQLEIRRKLYLRKRPEPKDDSDPWFIQMDAKLAAWRDASPDNDSGSGLDKRWHVGRYNTMIVFLCRPSPQIPRPSLAAAIKCFDACEYNIHMQRDQITRKNVDLTWIFTQSLFMAINTLLWSLSYVEIRKNHTRASVESLLDVAMEGIKLASERWPGVSSAVQLYQNLILAIMKIYEKDDDVPIAATTPSDAASPSIVSTEALNRSRATTPATVASSSVATPPERSAPPFGYLNHAHISSVEQAPPQPWHHDPSQPQFQSVSAAFAPGLATYDAQIPLPHLSQHISGQLLDPYSQISTLPEFTPEITVPGWNNLYYPGQHADLYSSPHSLHDNLAGPVLSSPYTNDLLNPSTAFGNNPNYQQHTPQFWDLDASAFGNGLSQSQQQELMHTLESQGMEDIQHMITSSMAAMAAMAPKRG